VGAGRLRRREIWFARIHPAGHAGDVSNEGFEGIVGAVIPIPDDQPDTPAHWSVTFATDDADATAAKATELGGQVIVPPFDAPWSTEAYTIRLTVISDPQGATFSASKFVSKM
jgi:uncharacterized protein